MGISDQHDSVRQNIQEVRRILNEQIFSPVPLLRGHSKERVHILDLMSRTVNAGESNSALLIGPRGCGKTTLVKNVLNELEKDPTFSDKAIVVHLNGLIHTDDRLSLQDITRQMQLENVVQDKVFGSFSENLTFLLECLRLGEKGTSKATLIILDEFDLFCNHKNQTLLYNLFDVSQSAQAPICVVGITCRLDVTELLEKRVRSRFSHRQILLLPESGDENSFVNIAADLLSLPKKALKCPGEKKIISTWNDAVKNVLSNVEVSSILRQLMDVSKNERVLRNFLACIISRLDEKHSMLDEGVFIRISKLFIGVDSKVQMLEGLSVLELCLVISMKHINEIYDKEPFNFEMVFAQYKKFISKQSTVQGVEKHIALGAFETLQRLEFIQPAAKGSMKIKYSSGNDKAYQKEFQLFYFLVTSDQVMDAVRNYKDLPTEVAQWASSSLV
ncbi:origin recognition complex subunit 4 [Ischnura elegans]|uniref:origin recognition complex subunit 4 n=1 Tax=Ischnura elegans TaxID=197161 RepID=UPI001ED86B79|nr:origin recognition complex subunit 4 [Ischnura elegans]